MKHAVTSMDLSLRVWSEIRGVDDVVARRANAYRGARTSLLKDSRRDQGCLAVDACSRRSTRRSMALSRSSCRAVCTTTSASCCRVASIRENFRPRRAQRSLPRKARHYWAFEQVENGSENVARSRTGGGRGTGIQRSLVEFRNSTSNFANFIVSAEPSIAHLHSEGFPCAGFLGFGPLLQCRHPDHRRHAALAVAPRAFPNLLNGAHVVKLGNGNAVFKTLQRAEGVSQGCAGYHHQSGKRPA